VQKARLSETLVVARQGDGIKSQKTAILLFPVGKTSNREPNIRFQVEQAVHLSKSMFNGTLMLD
jgi:hypothetical protein